MQGVMMNDAISIRIIKVMSRLRAERDAARDSGHSPAPVRKQSRWARPPGHEHMWDVKDMVIVYRVVGNE